MPITEVLEENCRKFGNDICLVEINPEIEEAKRVGWKERGLMEPSTASYFRREITWNVFNEKANRFANLLLSRGIKKGDKVGILLMNCLEWLPIYFGALKTGALAVPLNFRYAADEIEYCVNLAECNVLVFGPEFVTRVEEIYENINKGRLLFYVGGDCPEFAESYNDLTANCASVSPDIKPTDDDDEAIYFSSEQQDSLKLFCIIIQALCIHVRQNRHIMARQGKMYSYAFLLYIIPVQKCIGLVHSL